MKRFALWAAVCFIPAAIVIPLSQPPRPAYAQAVPDLPKIILPTTVTADPGDFISVRADTTGTLVKWVAMDKGLKAFPTDLLKDTRTAVFVGQVPGQYRILAYTSTAAGPSDPAICTITINGPPVPPTPPVPPVPPTPPLPPAPIPIAGLRVMMIEESADRGKISKGQFATLVGDGNFRDWLNSIVDKKDGQPELRIYDKDATVSNDYQHWQDVFKQRPANFKTPWLIISNGQNGYSGPMLDTLEENKALIQKYGGAK